jgi:predicted phosphodiesterase
MRGALAAGESEMNQDSRVTRRDFLCRGVLVLPGPAIVGTALAEALTAENGGAKPKVRVGLVTDLHYADKDPLIHRFYRETLTKIAEAARQFREDKTDVVIELGDLVDVGQTLAAEKAALRRIVKEFRASPGQHHCVLGNHCVWNLTKSEFLEIAGQKRSYYSFDAGACHFVVLDACFRSDGEPYGRRNFQWTDANLPPAELEWLRADLKRTQRTSLVFVHQRLDAAPPYGVQNAAEVRKILEASGKVSAVVQGHFHMNDYQKLGGIHYVTLAAMVEGSGEANNAYAVLEVFPDGAIRIRGFRRQKGYEFKPAAAQAGMKNGECRMQNGPPYPVPS